MTKRIAIIDRELCKPKITGYACQKACPVNRTGKDCMTTGDDTKILIDELLCIGCGICVKKCPQNAIKIVNLPDRLDESPVHRYGPNLFSLYRLPVPRTGAVVGLVGQNGTGKSTMINILSGNLKPNAGIFGGVPWKNVIERFRGSELQPYLEQLAEKKLKAAYKPQNVDSIPDFFSGKAGEFLKKADTQGRLEEVATRLGIEGIYDKSVSKLSGGELQLLAIAATMLKDADFYFFDEPSSYLDVRQRLVVAREIRALSEKARVMLIEHDLSIADYMADHVHVIYGQPGAFGVVSKPYGVRVGINTYLDGYIAEENVRFRPDAVTFFKTSKGAAKDRLFLSFPKFRKSFRGFELETAGGNLYRGEVIGILGPNATGKSTLIKMLTGEVVPDEGENIKDLKLAYKPQRLALSKAEGLLTVNQLLEERAGRRLAQEDRKNLRFLGLEPLMDRTASSLSGGELQSCLIAAAIAQDKDIMLLDEPSAFLDVEQRLRVARLLRSHVESTDIPCFVVDHDLLFIDALSDRVMVFSGQPGKSGKASPPALLKDGMNSFLKELGVTFRRDKTTGRPRANKPDSQLDIQQKEQGNYYYTE